MAMNPKGWNGATPHTHSGKIDKSGPAKELKHNATRPTMPGATSMDHYAPVPKSGQGYKKLGHSGTAMGEPYAMSSDRKEMKSGMEMPSATKKSKPEVPAEAKSWKKKGYNASLPTTMAEGAAIASKMKAK